ncbi:MAG: DUF7178 family protein [Planctomycetota bacterium]|jgi:hypothetical protein
MRWIETVGGIIELSQRCAVEIGNWYGCATPSELRAGMRWYYDAHCAVSNLRDWHNLPSIKAAAGVVAALSPQQPWKRNIALADELLDNPMRSLHYPVQLDKALRCAELLQCDKLSDILIGPKELSFARNIGNPRDCHTVTVDGFSAQLALGDLAPSKDRAAYLLRLSGVYTATADAYRRVAKIYDVLPSTVQATTWLQWRTEHKTPQQ